MTTFAEHFLGSHKLCFSEKRFEKLKCEKFLNLKHGSISCWYSVVIPFFSLLFQDQQIYYNGNNFCAFDASSIWKKIWEACEILNLQTWFHFLLVFFCHEIFFFIIPRCLQIYYNGNNFLILHLTLASQLKKDLRSLWNSEPQTWFHFLLVFCCHFFFLFYSKINKFITTAITFAHLTLASNWKKIWEACEILNLKHGSIFVGILLSFFFFLYYSKINKFITTAITFVAFDASPELKKDLRSLWNSEPKTWFHFLLVFCCHSFFSVLYYSKINKFITTAITFAHLTLASIWKKIWEACEILNLKHGSIFCWYSVVILFFSLLFQDQQIYYNGNNFLVSAFDASLKSEKRFEKLVKFWT